jgi:hypothetical protein
MTTRGTVLRRKDRPFDLPKEGDGIRLHLPPARRETILQSLQLLQAEAARVELTRSDRREVVRRINMLRNLLGWPAL